jgi:2-haloalkanoic acid dehalogenase type II
MSSLNGIKAVVFDLDGTLRHNQPDSTNFFLDLAVELGVRDSEEKRRHVAKWIHYYWAQSPELSQDMQIYTTLSEAFWQRYANRALVEFGCKPEKALALAPELHSQMETRYQPIDAVFSDAPSTLAALQKAGYKLAVLSNRSTPFQETLAKLGIGEYFQFALAAGEVGAWKPDPAAFLPALERLGLAPKEVVYVGDNYYADIVGARRAGLNPILIDPQGIFDDPSYPIIRDLAALEGLLIRLAPEQNP